MFASAITVAACNDQPASSTVDKDPTMPDLLLTDVQTTNLQTLYAIRLGIEADFVDTCRKYALSAMQAERLRALHPEQLWMLVHSIGQATLFVPRDDLVALIDAPAPLAGALAALHTPMPI